MYFFIVQLPFLATSSWNQKIIVPSLKIKRPGEKLGIGFDTDIVGNLSEDDVADENSGFDER